MKDILAILVLVAIIVLFFYYGYKDDFSRNPKKFLKTILGVPIGIFNSILGLLGINTFIKEWIKKEDKWISGKFNLIKEGRELSNQTNIIIENQEHQFLWRVNHDCQKLARVS